MVIPAIFFWESNLQEVTRQLLKKEQILTWIRMSDLRKVPAADRRDRFCLNCAGVEVGVGYYILLIAHFPPYTQTHAHDMMHIHIHRHI